MKTMMGTSTLISLLRRMRVMMLVWTTNSKMTKSELKGSKSRTRRRSKSPSNSPREHNSISRITSKEISSSSSNVTVAPGEAVEAVIRVENSNIGVITIEGWTTSKEMRGHSNNILFKQEKGLFINLNRMRDKMIVIETQREGTEKIEVEVAREVNTSPVVVRVKKMTVKETQREGTDKIEVEVAREVNTRPEVAKEAAVGTMTTIGEVVRKVTIEVVANINNVEEVEGIAITTSVKVQKTVIITTLLLTPSKATILIIITIAVTQFNQSNRITNLLPSTNPELPLNNIIMTKSMVMRKIQEIVAAEEEVATKDLVVTEAEEAEGEKPKPARPIMRRTSAIGRSTYPPLPGS